MIMRSREKVWVIQAGKIAAKIKKQLFQVQIIVKAPAGAEDVPPPQVQPPERGQEL
jgi:hypothetical protein